MSILTEIIQQEAMGVEQIISLYTVKSNIDTEVIKDLRNEMNKNEKSAQPTVLVCK